RAVVAGEGAERQSSETADGTGSPGHVEIRPADARGIYQQSSGTHRQQNVRMRHDSVMIGNKSIGWVLLLALGVLLAIPNAQGKPQAAKKKVKAAAAEASPAPEPSPSLRSEARRVGEGWR